MPLPRLKHLRNKIREFQTFYTKTVLTSFFLIKICIRIEEKKNPNILFLHSYQIKQ